MLLFFLCRAFPCSSENNIAESHLLRRAKAVDIETQLQRLTTILCSRDVERVHARLVVHTATGVSLWLYARSENLLFVIPLLYSNIDESTVGTEAHAAESEVRR